jgi:transposase InsO family protein
MEHIRSDNGPEFVAKRVRKWLAGLGTKPLYIEPCSPWENGYCESFNSKLRDEFLNGEVFYSLKEAQVLTARWRCTITRAGHTRRWTPARRRQLRSNNWRWISVKLARWQIMRPRLTLHLVQKIGQSTPAAYSVFLDFGPRRQEALSWMHAIGERLHKISRAKVSSSLPNSICESRQDSGIFPSNSPESAGQ